MLANTTLLIYLTLASRFHGGGFFSAPRVLRAAVFALPYAVVLYQTPYIAALAFVLAFVGKNIGHEDFWQMGTGIARPDSNWLCKLIMKLGLKRDTLPFCTLGMAIKGLITSLGTLNPLVILGHTVALPLAYFIGFRTKWGSELAEYLSGFLYGLTLAFLMK